MARKQVEAAIILAAQANSVDTFFKKKQSAATWNCSPLTRAGTGSIVYGLKDIREWTRLAHTAVLPIRPRRDFAAVVVRHSPPSSCRESQVHASATASRGLGRPGKGPAERRQLTVLFCDLVGSTSLSERLDPEELRDLVCEYQQVCLDVVRRNEGHIAQYLGDGVLIYFGYPIAHEDEARRAVRSALGILAGVKELSKGLQEQSRLELSVRIGGHTGQVVVGEVGSGDSRAQLALGEAPNLAARAQNLADPDTIVISAATYQLVEPFFICQDLGTHSVKGMAHPVKLYRVLGETRTQTRMQAAATHGMTPLVGRERERKFLLECWERAKGGRGQSVLVSGEPGIGKSRVIEELKQNLAGEAFCLIEGYCSSYQQNTAFAPISDLLRHALGIAAEDSTQEKLGKLNAAVAGLVFESKYAIPLIAQILSIPLSEDHPPLDLTPVRQRQLTLEILTSWLLGSAKGLATPICRGGSTLGGSVNLGVARPHHEPAAGTTHDDACEFQA